MVYKKMYMNNQLRDNTQRRKIVKRKKERKKVENDRQDSSEVCSPEVPKSLA